MILLGFQPLLSSVKVCYFLLKSKFVKRLENRLPKRHGGSNPSSCAKKQRTLLVGVLYFLPQSEALERPSVTLRVAGWGSHLSVSHRGARSPVAERKIFVKDEYPSSKPHINAILFFNTFIFSSNESYSVKASTISVSFSKVGLTGYFLFIIKPFSQVSNFTVTLLFC